MSRTETAIDSESLYDEGLQLMHHGRFHQAARTFQRLIDKYPEHAPAHCNLGIIWMRMKQWWPAEKAMRRYAELAPTDSRGYVRMGIILRELNDYKNAIRSFRNALNLDAKNAITFCEIGSTFLAMDKLDRALESYKQALKLRPKSITAVCGLAEVYERKKMPGMVCKVYARAIKYGKPSKIGPIYGKLGKFYTNHGHWEDACKAYTKTLELGESNDEFNFELGIANFKCGDMKSAQDQLIILDSIGSQYAETLREIIETGHGNTVS